MAFDLFGLLPNPDDAYDNAPQVPINSANLERLRQKMVGLSDAKKGSMRDEYNTALNNNANEANNAISNSTRNASTAIAQDNRVSGARMDNTNRAEMGIANADLQAEQNGEEMYNQEYARLDNVRGQNKVTRELARENAKIARNSALANIGGKALGVGLSAVVGPAGMEIGETAGDVAGRASTKDARGAVKELNAEQSEYMPDDLSNPLSEVDTPEAQDILKYSDNYIVKGGDTLGGIAQYYGTTVDKLMEYNPEITNPDVIQSGQKLRINPIDTPSKPYVPAEEPSDTLMEENVNPPVAFGELPAVEVEATSLEDRSQLGPVQSTSPDDQEYWSQFFKF